MANPRFTFEQARKEDSRLRMALTGPSGSGKTYTGLIFATAMDAGPVGVIDTEHRSSLKYADQFDFRVCALHSYHPAHYVEAIHAADNAGVGVLLIDSLSHAWNGKDGALEIVDKEAGSSGNKFAGWARVTPLQNALIEAILGAECHIIATMRTKTAYILEERENRNGRLVQTPVKVGTQAIQRDGIEYEFDLVGRMDLDNNLAFEKTRCTALKGVQVPTPGPALMDQIKAWLKGWKLEDIIDADLAELREMLEHPLFERFPEKKIQATEWLANPANHVRVRMSVFRQNLLAFLAAQDGQKEAEAIPAGIEGDGDGLSHSADLFHGN